MVSFGRPSNWPHSASPIPPGDQQRIGERHIAATGRAGPFIKRDEAIFFDDFDFIKINTVAVFKTANCTANSFQQYFVIAPEIGKRGNISPQEMSIQRNRTRPFGNLLILQ
jgi:hypothetical protein